MDLTSREKLLALGQGTWRRHRRQQRLISKTAHSNCQPPNSVSRMPGPNAAQNKTQ